MVFPVPQTGPDRGEFTGYQRKIIQEYVTLMVLLLSPISISLNPPLELRWCIPVHLRGGSFRFSAKRVMD
jgi:hypothetical protein